MEMSYELESAIKLERIEAKLKLMNSIQFHVMHTILSYFYLDENLDDETIGAVISALSDYFSQEICKLEDTKAIYSQISF